MKKVSDLKGNLHIFAYISVFFYSRTWIILLLSKIEEIRATRKARDIEK